MASAPKRKPGRPELPPDQRTEPVAVRLTPSQRAKVRHGPTLERLRQWLDRQPMPPESEG